jgi:hypothetical protein
LFACFHINSSACFKLIKVFATQFAVILKFDWCLTVNTNKTKVLIFNKAGKHIKDTFNFNDTQLECVNRYKYLGIHFCASGSFYFAQEELYKKALKSYFKFSKDLLSLNPTIKTSMHVFDHSSSTSLLEHLGHVLLCRGIP